MTPVKADAYGWAHATMDGFACDRCGARRTLPDSLTKREFQREAYDFLLRHKGCTDPERVQ